MIRVHVNGVEHAVKRSSIAYITAMSGYNETYTVIVLLNNKELMIDENYNDLIKALENMENWRK